MKNNFSKAIGKTGGIAVIPQLGGAYVVVSVQPDGFFGDAREETGSGPVCRYKFFTPYNDTAEKILKGSELVFLGSSYLVESVTTAFIGDHAVYRQGTLLLERKTDDE